MVTSSTFIHQWIVTYPVLGSLQENIAHAEDRTTSVYIFINVLKIYHKEDAKQYVQQQNL